MAGKWKLELDDGWIELEVTGYDFPEHLPGGDEFDYDANWLKLGCRRCVGGGMSEVGKVPGGRELSESGGLFGGGVRSAGGCLITGEEPCLMTVDVRRMIAELQAYREGERTSIGCGGLEPNFGLELERRRDGDWLDLFFWAERAGESYGAAPHFCRRISREELDGLILFWEQALEAFPVRENREGSEWK